MNGLGLIGFGVWSLGLGVSVSRVSRDWGFMVYGHGV